MSLDVTPSPIPVLLVDDDAFVRQGLRQYLEFQGPFVAREAGDVRSALAMLNDWQPRVAVLDIVLPAAGHLRAESQAALGLELAFQLKERDAALGIVLFSAHEIWYESFFKLVQRGYNGLAYLLKGQSPKKFIYAMQSVALGEIVVDDEVMHAANRFWNRDQLLNQLSTPAERPLLAEAFDRYARLNETQKRLVAGIGSSLNAQALGKMLGLTPATIDKYTSRLYSELGLAEEIQSPVRPMAVVVKLALMTRLLGMA